MVRSGPRRFRKKWRIVPGTGFGKSPGAPKGIALTTFHDLGLSKTIVATLSALGFEKATPIQEKAIPLVLEGSDLIGLAQTGTGKTAAFGLPMIEKLLLEARRPDPRNIRALILAPTRELVNQIADNLRDFVKKTPLRVVTVVGGASINKQSEMLNRGTDILVATPGRLLDLVARKSVTLTQARYLVLDEADQMLDLGFIHDLRKISKMVPKNRQTLLFSATMPKLIAELAGEYLVNPKKVEVTPPGKAADKVEQYVHFVPGKDQKTQILKQTLTANPDGLSLVFSRTKHGAEKLMKHLDHIGFKAAGEPIYLIGAEPWATPHQERGHLGQSLWLREIHGREEGDAPHVDLTLEKNSGEFVRKLIAAGLVSAVHDVSDGGLAVTLAEMALASGLGAETMAAEGYSPAEWWFGEDQGRYVVTVPDLDAFQRQIAKGTRNADTASSGLRRIGTVGGDNLFGVLLGDLRAAHESFFKEWMEA